MMRTQGRDLHGEFVRLLPRPAQPIRIQRGSLRRVGLVALVAVMLAFLGTTIAGGVTSNEAGKTPLYIGNLACTDFEPLWLQAQAVPSAALVPCVRSLPAGWTLRSVTVNDGRSVLTLDNDRAGAGAMVVRLSAGCDIRGATPVPSEQPGAQGFTRIERLAPQFSATHLDVFAGGCITTHLTAPAAHRAELTSEAPLLLGFTTRQALQQALSQRSNGRLQLDPGPGDAR